MPVTITNINGYQVRTPNRIHARKTTYQKAQAQAALLRAVEHSDWKPTGKPGRKYSKKSTAYQALRKSK